MAIARRRSWPISCRDGRKSWLRCRVWLCRQITQGPVSGMRGALCSAGQCMVSKELGCGLPGCSYAEASRTSSLTSRSTQQAGRSNPNALTAANPHDIAPAAHARVLVNLPGITPAHAVSPASHIVRDPAVQVHPRPIPRHLYLWHDHFSAIAAQAGSSA
jgi:hypothetical protein